MGVQIANMFWVPFAMKLGSTVSVGRYIGSSMIPTMVGNGLSAAFFLAGSYAFCYGTLPLRVERMWLRLRGKTSSDPNYQDASFVRKEGVPPSMYSDGSSHDNKQYPARYSGGVPPEAVASNEPLEAHNAKGPVVMPQQATGQYAPQHDGPAHAENMV